MHRRLASRISKMWHARFVDEFLSRVHRICNEEAEEDGGASSIAAEILNVQRTLRNVIRKSMSPSMSPSTAVDSTNQSRGLQYMNLERALCVAVKDCRKALGRSDESYMRAGIHLLWAVGGGTADRTDQDLPWEDERTSGADGLTLGVSPLLTSSFSVMPDRPASVGGVPSVFDEFFNRRYQKERERQEEAKRKRLVERDRKLRQNFDRLCKIFTQRHADVCQGRHDMVTFVNRMCDDPAIANMFEVMWLLDNTPHRRAIIQAYDQGEAPGSLESDEPSAPQSIDVNRWAGDPEGYNNFMYQTYMKTFTQVEIDFIEETNEDVQPTVEEITTRLEVIGAMDKTDEYIRRIYEIITPGDNSDSHVGTTEALSTDPSAKIVTSREDGGSFVATPSNAEVCINAKRRLAEQRDLYKILVDERSSKSSERQQSLVGTSTGRGGRPCRLSRIRHRTRMLLYVRGSKTLPSDFTTTVADASYAYELLRVLERAMQEDVSNRGEGQEIEDQCDASSSNADTAEGRQPEFLRYVLKKNAEKQKSVAEVVAKAHAPSTDAAGTAAGAEVNEQQQLHDAIAASSGIFRNDAVDRIKRQAIWNDGLRELGMGGDRLYAFMRQMAGLLNESVDALANIDDEDMQHVARQERRRYESFVREENNHQRRVAETIAASLFNGSTLRVNMGKGAMGGEANEPVTVFNEQAFQQLAALESGRSGVSMLVGENIIRERLGKMRDSPVTLTDLMKSVRETLESTAAKRYESLSGGAVGSGDVGEFGEDGDGMGLSRFLADRSPGANFSYLGQPHVCFMIRLKNEVFAALNSAVDMVRRDIIYRAGGRGGRFVDRLAWRLIEGDDVNIRNLFAEFCARVIASTRAMAPNGGLQARRSSMEMHFRLGKRTLAVLVDALFRYRPPKRHR